MKSRREIFANSEYIITVDSCKIEIDFSSLIKLILNGTCSDAVQLVALRTKVLRFGDHWYEPTDMVLSQLID
jgi:hypothetical protein